MQDAKEDNAAHMVADQEPVARLLSDPATHGSEASDVKRLDTHASMVFLAGDRVYKVKRAVNFPYMDFSTLEKRRRACARELELNRRTAPEIYLGACPVLRDEDGGLRLGPMDAEGARSPEGKEAVEWAVVMRRFPQEKLLDRLADEEALDAATVDALAAAIADFHDRAESVEGGGAAALGWVIAENAEEFPQSPELFPSEDAEALNAASRQALEAVRDLLDRRAADGLVRRCHGDLHLRNVVLLEDGPRLFDAIEFNDDIACIDVLYDLAFMLMDLDRRELGWAANRLLNRYLQDRDDLEGLAAMPLFLSLRAAIRAKVNASALAAQRDAAARERLRAEAGALFQAAQAYLKPAPPCLVAVGGVSGTGKTTLARELAPGLGAPPGALIFRSDVERKRIFGVGETERLPEAAYQGRINAQVYEQMLERARRALVAGRSAIVEATFLRREDRAEVRKLGEAAGVRYCGLWLQAPEPELMSRVAGRSGDASDATREVVAGQLERAPKGEVAWPSVDAGGNIETVAARARDTLREAGLLSGPGQ
ncbi:AAA family ATPase [Ferruginivarius sediminum]|uniref:Aminoglycoside phosphotransferase n=1 Tax=Ferruginivarius sediminum TaxID=2661937 RepID=A0A369T925_9PROT|nr:bifunctional aminoglycoside phosphotransferase/ATP-binding protein [Ferruginivarius sediminum]RDD61813.1 aminoglycoside phosphotransferase [Ferruginivarius sediminum]